MCEQVECLRSCRQAVLFEAHVLLLLLLLPLWTFSFFFKKKKKFNHALLPCCRAREEQREENISQEEPDCVGVQLQEPHSSGCCHSNTKVKVWNFNMMESDGENDCRLRATDAPSHHVSAGKD